MHLPVPIDDTSTPEQVARDIQGIDVSGFDSERNRLRYRMVVQRFTLGLVELFETFPQLDCVLFLPNENVASMIVPPDVSDAAFNRRVSKSLQSARASICPQSRDTRDALACFFGQACPVKMELPRQGTVRASRLDRVIFSRMNLLDLCADSVQRLDPALYSSLRARALLETAASVSTPSAGPKMKM